MRFAQLDAELATHQALWPLGTRLVISQVSHQHIYGLLFAILRPLCEGAPLADATCRYPETLHAWLAALAADEAVLISAPPPLERLPESLDWPAVRARLAYVHSSGAPLSAAASARAARSTRLSGSAASAVASGPVSARLRPAAAGATLSTSAAGPKTARLSSRW